MTGTCTDNAGNASSPLPYGLKFDATGPEITSLAPERPPDFDGWYNRPVRFDVAGTDALSGLAECPSVFYSGPDGNAARVNAACGDRAGNTSIRSFLLPFDASAPVIDRFKAAAGDRKIDVSWTRPPDVTSVELTRSPGRGKAAETVVHSGPGKVFRDRKVKNGKRYAYRLRMADAAGNVTVRSVSTKAGPRLVGPAAGAELSRKRRPLLRWTPVRQAGYYNVQVFRGGRKIISAWPEKTRFRLKRKWVYAGRSSPPLEGNLRVVRLAWIRPAHRTALRPAHRASRAAAPLSPGCARWRSEPSRCRPDGGRRGPGAGARRARDMAGDAQHGRSSAGLPDIEQIPPYKIGVVQRDGRWYLGFASAARNVGAGGFRIRGSRRPDGTMAAQQVTDDGLQVLKPAVGTLRYVTTYGHAHWHYMRFMRYELRGIDVPGALMDRKQGFCLGDAPWVEGWCARGRPEISAIDEGIRAGRRRHLRAQRRRPGDRDRPPHGAHGPLRPDVADRADGLLEETRTDNNVASTVIYLRWPLADGQALAPVGSCVGEGCAGPVPPAPRLPRMSAAHAQGLARQALRRELGPLRSHPRIRCRTPRKRRTGCAVRLARGNARFAGTVRVWYRQEGAAARWYYSVDVIRRLTGCRGGGCTRDLRRPNRLGGTVHR